MSLAGTLLSALGASLGCNGRETDVGRTLEPHAPVPTSRVDAGRVDAGRVDAGGATPNAGDSGNTPGDAPRGGEGVDSGAGGAPKRSAFPCENSVSLAPDMPGFERCVGDEKRLFRASVEQCSSVTARPLVPDPAIDGCVLDSECKTGQICLCESPVGRCVDATCSSDADCGEGFRCQSYDGFAIGGWAAGSICDIVRFACQLPADTCGSNAGCPPEAAFCNADNGQFECRNSGPHCAVVGRPFLVSGLPRVAALGPKQHWVDAELQLSVAQYPPELLAVASRAWARVGLMEHASVAAFARFGLQLLSLGAPAELLELTAEAMSDEIRHARLAFAVASQLAGYPIGPGALNVAGALEPSSLGELLRLVFHEGCVGETIAALSAREAAAHAKDPALRALLDRVADDETRHSALAWRFVAWALDREPGLKESLQAEVAQVLVAPSLRLGDAANEPESLLWLGVLSARLEQQVRAAALSDVIVPCASLLLGDLKRLRETEQVNLGA